MAVFNLLCVGPNGSLNCLLTRFQTVLLLLELIVLLSEGTDLTGHGLEPPVTLCLEGHKVILRDSLGLIDSRVNHFLELLDAYRRLHWVHHGRLGPHWAEAGTGAQ